MRRFSCMTIVPDLVWSILLCITLFETVKPLTKPLKPLTKPGKLLEPLETLYSFSSPPIGDVTLA